MSTWRRDPSCGSSSQLNSSTPRDPIDGGLQLAYNSRDAALPLNRRNRAGGIPLSRTVHNALNRLYLVVLAKGSRDVAQTEHSAPGATWIQSSHYCGHGAVARARGVATREKRSSRRAFLKVARNVSCRCTSGRGRKRDDPSSAESRSIRESFASFCHGTTHRRHEERGAVRRNSSRP